MWRNWNLFNEIDSLHREIDRLFEGFGGYGRGPFRSTFLPGRAARRYPMVNIHEDPERVTVEALAPGLDVDSLELSVKGDTLTITGEKRPLSEVKPEAYHRNERATGRFVRTLQLAAVVDDAKAEAHYENGLLTIYLPKAEQAKPRKITVKS